MLLIKPRISVHLLHLTWIMPVQDLPKTLKCLLDVLVDVNTLQSWNIFEEQNGQVVVKLRFDSGHYSPPSNKGPVAFKCKAPSQVKRDRDRLATYKQNQDKTAAVDHDPAHLSTPTHVDINVNRHMHAESRLQDVIRRPDPSTESKHEMLKVNDNHPVGVKTRSQMKRKPDDTPELLRCEMTSETVSTSVLDPVEPLCFNTTDASILSLDVTQDLSTIASNTDSELEPDKQETADVENSDYEHASVPPDFPPVWWETMRTDMRHQ